MSTSTIGVCIPYSTRISMSSIFGMTCIWTAFPTRRSTSWRASRDAFILTTNVKDFRPLLRDDCPGIIGIPDAWLPDRIDTKLTALLMRHGPNYFRGRYRPLAAEEPQSQAA